MKKRTLSKLKSLFGSKKGKRQLQEHTTKSSRTPSPVPAGAVSPVLAQNGDSFQPILRTPPPSRAGPPPSPPVPTNPVAPVAPEPSGPLQLMPCQVCGRTFVPQSLSKHVRICQKTAVKKRKSFDSSRQRREGTDLEQYLPKNFGLPENSPFLEKSPPPTAKPTPKPKPQSIRTSMTKQAAELQRCPHCSRAFGVRAFERHVEWCADKAKILPAAPAHPPAVATAKQRLNARIQYKAPLATRRRSSQTRDKSSNSRSASVESSRGVSPPPAPREYGDYKHGRNRASADSLSSNDYHDETSPHVPVIRNSRNAQHNLSGDANVKARQARLARDLSSSRKEQDPSPTPVQQSNTDPNITKNVPRIKTRNVLNAKKRQQLKKLEQIASKYSEEVENRDDKKRYLKKSNDKNQIPVAKKTEIKTMGCKLNKNVDVTTENKESNNSSKTGIEKSKTIAVKPPDIRMSQKKDVTNKVKRKTPKKNSIKAAKENSMSLDSLEESHVDGLSSITSACNSHSIGINTELLCVPCKIHENIDQKKNNKKTKKNPIDTEHIIGPEHNTQEPKVELLYQNPTIINSNQKLFKYITEDFSNSNIHISASTASTLDNLNSDETDLMVDSPTCDNFDTKLTYKLDSTLKATRNEVGIEKPVTAGSINKTIGETKAETHFEQITEEIGSLSEERFEENYEHDLSAEISNDSVEEKYDNENEAINEIECRHSSGETYTKFTENPDDLQEFMNLTDKLLTAPSNTEFTKIEQDLNNIHTPKTNSIETIQDLNVEAAKHNFSDTFEALKSDLKQLLQNSRNVGDVINKTDEGVNNINNENISTASKVVDDMEHITVYKLKFYGQQTDETQQKTENELVEEITPQFRLPLITDCKTPGRRENCTKKKSANIYKSNRKYKMLSEQGRNKKESQTFIVNENIDNSDNHSVSSDAPPLKLPRIDKKRLDDHYDPFVSAARQMKELMSAETNIPKKTQTLPIDHSRTLPALQQAKDKSSTYLRSDNTKMIKDTLNKTYQKTPTLQRMKSFGSSNENNNNTLGRCSSFRLNRNDKKPNSKLNTTFTKSSKENISTAEKNYFNRSNNLNRSFSSYTTSSYSTPKLKDKIPKITTSLYHSFQRTTIKQPLKLDKIIRNGEKKDLVNLDTILNDDNSSMTDSYIDPRLINENDNLPINVNTILNNPDIISSMESLLTTENLPAKFESFSAINQNNNNNSIFKHNHTDLNGQTDKHEFHNNTNKTTALIVDDMGMQYDKIMHSLEQSIASKTSTRDDDSLCEDFDLEEFMTSFDEEIHKHKLESKRTCSSTTRVVKQSELIDSNRKLEMNSVSSTPKVLNSMTPINKSMSLNFSSNNIVTDNLFPSSVKRSNSLLDSIQKKNIVKVDSGRSRQKSDQLEQDIMQSLKDFDKFYENDKSESMRSKDKTIFNGTAKRVKSEKKSNKRSENLNNGNYTPNGKSSNDSAYSSLNRISPSKLSICTTKEPSSGLTSLEQVPAESDSSGCHKEDGRSGSSDEFLEMERSAELDGPLGVPDPPYTDHNSHNNDKRVSSRASSRRSSTWRAGASGALSSSGSETSLHRTRKDSAPAPRLSRFCHECGNKFPVDTAKFCMECGVKRLVV